MSEDDSTQASESEAIEDAAEVPEERQLANDDFGMRNLEVIKDVPVRMSLEVGNTGISIGELLKLDRGSIVELNRLAGEPLDVLVNGMLVAHGEVVVVDEKFGIRLTDVVSAEQRIETLG